MVNEEILGGLKNSIARGETIQQAVLTFVNAGYLKKDVDEAVEMLNANEITQPKVSDEIVKEKPSIKSEPKSIQTEQKVSNYGEEKKTIGKSYKIILLVCLLILVLGILASIFIFKDQVMSVLSNLFG